MPEHSGPSCNRCGVLYVPEGDGQHCTEGTCSGRVTWEATADRLAQQLRGTVDLLREVRDLLPHGAFGGFRDPARWELLDRIDAALKAQ